jgi:hypothetical protein
VIVEKRNNAIARKGMRLARLLRREGRLWRGFLPHGASGPLGFFFLQLQEKDEKLVR